MHALGARAAAWYARSALATPSEQILLVPVRDLEKHEAEERRRAYAESGKAEGTWSVYDGHWARFEAFLGARGAPAELPVGPGLVADYIIHLRERGLAASTISVAVAAIGHRHKLRGAPSPLDHPQVGEVLAGARRMAARAQAGRGPSEPLLPSDLRAFIARLKPGLQGQRDMALLSFGLAGGFRREELARIRVEDLRIEKDGILVSLPYGKADQMGKGHTRRIAKGDSPELCPVTSVLVWLAASGVRTGPLFRPVMRGKVVGHGLSPRRIDQIVREYTRRVMADDKSALIGKKYSAHSLRSGLCTAAALAGKPESEIREHVGHKSAQSTARYIRLANVRKSTVTSGIGF